jgi:hypothetical protein
VLPLEWRLAQRVAVMAVALGAVLAGCGGSTPEQDGPAGSRDGVVRRGAPGSVTVVRGNAVPLGITPAQVVRRLGAPAAPLQRKDAYYRCMYYNVVDQPPTVQLQYCFADGELKIVASYIRSS